MKLKASFDRSTKLLQSTQIEKSKIFIHMQQETQAC